MTTPRNREGARPQRFVHLGDRLLAIARLRSGAASLEAIAEELGVEPGEIRRWLELHAGERVTTLEELREHGSPELRALAQRARRLAELVAEADRRIRDLHQEYLLSLAAAPKRAQSAK